MKNKKLIIAQVLLVLILAVVWGNSLLSGEKSGAISGGVTAWISRWLGINSANLGHIVRKCAHFGEFTLLGAVVSVLLIWKNQRGRMFYMPLIIGMMAFPLIDETIQIFSPDRGPAITDVWIDMSGYFLGAAVVCVIHKIITWRRKKKNELISKKNTSK